MPSPLTEYLSAWRTNYGHLGADLINAANYLDAAADQCIYENWNGLAVALNGAGIAMANAGLHCRLGTPNLYDTMFAATDWIDRHWPSDVAEYELTMEKILEAIWEADGFERFSFINYIDSMRASIWNVQVYDVYLEDLLRHFSV